MSKEIYFSANSFRFIANDRRVAKNTSDNQIAFQDEVQKAWQLVIQLGKILIEK